MEKIVEIDIDLQEALKALHAHEYDRVKLFIEAAQREVKAAQPRVQPTGETCLNCGRPLNDGVCAPCFAPSPENFAIG